MDIIDTWKLCVLIQVIQEQDGWRENDKKQITFEFSACAMQLISQHIVHSTLHLMGFSSRQ